MSWLIVVFCCLFNIILAIYFFFWCADSDLKGTNGECSFNLDTPPGSKRPIILKDGDTIEPVNESGNVSLQRHQTIQFLCSGPNNYVIAPSFGKLANGTCVDNNQFMINSDPSPFYNFNDTIKCKDPPQSTTTDAGNTTTDAGNTTTDAGNCTLGKFIKIGFEVIPNKKFLSKIELCFNPNDSTTYWTANLLRTSPYSCKISTRTNFKKNYFENVDPDRIYKNYPQYDKGHLTPVCDFFSGPEKRMTFYYINASPQLARFNRGNWKSLENEIRNATRRSRKLVRVYTGTAQTVQKLDGRLPVRRFFWKVVVENTTGDGIAFVGVNDVTHSVKSPCVTISCDELLWLSHNFRDNMRNVSKGQINCCTVEDFQKIENIQYPNFTHFRGGRLTNL